MRGVLVFIAALLMGSGAFAQTYVGDAACSGCHANMPTMGFFDGYMNSGHPWKLFRTAGADPAPDTWPNTPVPPLPVVNGMQLLWSDVEYVIGNFFWKTRYIDRDGFIWTGSPDDRTQWNIATQEFVPYHPGEVRPYNCGRCHTTGYDPQGNQNGLPGLVGTWFQDGIRCEACHGPASDHIANPIGNPPPGGKECAECHFRDSQFRMPWRGGFMRHHQQSEDLSHSAHAGVLTCESCHNPHRSVVYDDGGVKTTCQTCHPGDPGNNFYVVIGMESVDCTDCHMPKMAKSAVAFSEYRADVSGHLFQIMTDPIAAADNTYEEGGGTFWNQDVNGDAFITLDYACLVCHPTFTLDDASLYATGIHSGPLAVAITSFEALVRQDGVELRGQFVSNLGVERVNVYRGEGKTDDLSLLASVRDGLGSSFSYVDLDVMVGETYTYRIGVFDLDGEFVSQPRTVTVPERAISLGENVPNPFNPSTTITFTLPSAQPVRLVVFDASGRLVRVLFDGVASAGTNSVQWDGHNANGGRVGSGMYFYRMTAGKFDRTRKMVLLK